jgi:hypothetical protein
MQFMQIHYEAAIEQLREEINTLNEKLSGVTDALKNIENRERKARILSSWGVERPLLRFLSQPTVRLREVKIVGVQSTPNDFVACLSYEIDSEKNSKNMYRCFPASLMIEQQVNAILSKPSVRNSFIEPFTTEKKSFFILFWEEAATDNPLDALQ